MLRLNSIYLKLHEKFGLPQEQWGQWCAKKKTISDREEIIIGSILTQNTNWRNVTKAIANLKQKRWLSLSTIARSQASRLAPIIKPAGFFNQKALYLISVAKFFESAGGVKRIMKQDVSELRKNLLAIKGIGPETADSIILYACDLPVFVIDEYTRRFVRKEKLTKKLEYQSLQRYFEQRLDKDIQLWQDFHALIVIAGKNKL